MSYPEKPNHLKVISGSQKPQRAPSTVNYEALSEVPPAPDWLPNEHAIAEWNRLGPMLVENRVLSRAALSGFGALCACHGEIVSMWSRQVTPTASQIQQYRALLNDFGLTPTSQGKVNPAAPEKNANRFSQNGQRTAA